MMAKTEKGIVRRVWWRRLASAERHPGVVQAPYRANVGTQHRGDALTDRAVAFWVDQVHRAAPVYRTEALFWSAHQLALATGTAEDRRAAVLALYDIGLASGLSARRVTVTLVEGFSEALWPTE